MANEPSPPELKLRPNEPSPPELKIIVVGRVNSRVLVTSNRSQKMATIPIRMVEPLQTLGVNIVDKPENYVL